MDHQDHVDLIRKGVTAGRATWAEFGSGSGHFTLALAELLGPQGMIYSVDIDQQALGQQKRRLQSRFSDQPGPTVQFIQGDYTHLVALPPLDGLLMANSLHFQRHKGSVLETVCGYLRLGGRFLLVEYNTDRGNQWVPYPVSFPTWKTLASRTGLTGTQLLNRMPSNFLREFYSAVSFKP